YVAENPFVASVPGIERGVHSRCLVDDSACRRHEDGGVFAPDCFCGKFYDIEIQNTDSGAGARRENRRLDARFLMQKVGGYEKYHTCGKSVAAEGR
uniref:hypothetical protein n=1 Tax=Treponema sp. TaxID=166 RepID=UPI00257B5892